ncbi:MAG: DUF3006 domain-containing protein [Defluviitaleaceae bacterium]|nr:DUF3006 domain-containing protein [Defluviitaleaceae bacterium]
MLESIKRAAPRWVIDRIEESWAVLENTSTMETINLPVKNLPRDARPGDSLIQQNSKWYKDEADTQDRAKRISEAFQRVKAANPRT